MWMQHPTLRFLSHEMFDVAPPLDRAGASAEELPIDLTVAAMDQAGISYGLLSAWQAPGEVLIENDEVQGWVAAASRSVRRIGRSRPSQAHGSGA